MISGQLSETAWECNQLHILNQMLGKLIYVSKSVYRHFISLRQKIRRMNKRLWRKLYL